MKGEEGFNFTNFDPLFDRIYIYFLDFKEVALNTSKILGQVEMMKKIGKQMDYRIVLIEPQDITNKPSISMVKQFRQSVIDLI